MKNKKPIAWNDEVGLAAKYAPIKEVILDDWANTFFAFYPSSTFKGTLSFIINHPQVPVKVRPGDTQLKVVLNKGESILIEPYVDRGELSSIMVGIGGTTGYTSFTYDKKYSSITKALHFRKARTNRQESNLIDIL